MGKKLPGVSYDHPEHFSATHPGTEWETALEHSEKIGLGTRKYELIKC